MPDKTTAERALECASEIHMTLLNGPPIHTTTKRHLDAAAAEAVKELRDAAQELILAAHARGGGKSFAIERHDWQKFKSALARSKEQT